MIEILLIDEGRSKVIQDFSECFSFQIGQLLSIQLEEEPILEGRKVMNDISLDNLEKVLTQTIYDYILKNPTIFHTKSRSIIPQRKKEVKERDNFICQICNENFNEDELEVDHVYPHSLGGSNRIENLMALCINCNRDKGKRLDYYRSGEGRNLLSYYILIEILLIDEGEIFQLMDTQSYTKLGI